MDTKIQARRTLTGSGWLARQPRAFQEDVLQRGLMVAVRAGDWIYRAGDPPGGILGLVSGSFSIMTGPDGALPMTAHLAAPGHWTGEGCYLSGEARRVGLRAILDCALLTLPLDQMHQMAAADPEAARRFGLIALLNTDLAVRVVHDLLLTDRDARLAAALARCGAIGAPLPVCQHDLGAMANVPRKQVNAALRRFAEKGWIEPGYRSIRVVDPAALDGFARAAEGG